MTYTSVAILYSFSFSFQALTYLYNKHIQRHAQRDIQRNVMARAIGIYMPGLAFGAASFGAASFMAAVTVRVADD